MVELMTGDQYKEACCYRMQETLENLLSSWNHEYNKNIADVNHIDETILLLENTIDELKYFREKIKKRYTL